MKLTIDKIYFLEKIKIACDLINNQFVIAPVLSNLLLEIKDNKIIVISSNNNLSIKIEIKEKFEVEGEGKFLIKGNLFFNVISKINTENITIETLDSSILRISSKNYSCDLNLQDEKSYPIINFDYTNWSKNIIDWKFIKEIKSKITRCVLQNAGKNNVLSGVLLDGSRLDDQIEAIGTDSFHLAYIKTKSVNNKFKFILNTDVFDILDQILAFNKNEIIFHDQNNQLIIEIGNILLSCHLIEGNYPSAIKVIEEPCDYHFKIDKNKLLNAIDLANVLMISDKKPSVFLKITKDNLLVKSQSMEQGSSNEAISITESNVNEIEFCLNIKFLTNLIKNIKSSNIEFYFNSPNKPLILKQENDSNYLSLILPIRML